MLLLQYYNVVVILQLQLLRQLETNTPNQYDRILQI